VRSDGEGTSNRPHQQFAVAVRAILRETQSFTNNFADRIVEEVLDAQRVVRVHSQERGLERFLCLGGGCVHRLRSLGLAIRHR